MSRDAGLLDRIYRLARGDLDQAVVPLPANDHLVRAFEWLELPRVAAFWRPGADLGPSLGEACLDLATGLAHLGGPCAYWLRGTPTSVAVRFGTPRGSGAAADALCGLLAASFPDVRLRPVGETVVAEEGALPSVGVQLTGIPAEKPQGRNGTAGEQIDKICRALAGVRWSYLVHARPINPAEVVATLNQLLSEIRSIRSTLMLKGTVDEENRLAKQYVELLEAQVKRYEAARGIGMWDVSAFLRVADGTAGRARAAAINGFAGEGSHPVPFRVLTCDRDAGPSPACEPLTSRDLSILLQLPRESCPGYEVTEPARFSLRAPSPARPGGPSVHLGEIRDRGRSTGNAFDVPVAELAKHILVSGVTGSGKTNTAFRLLESLWVEHGVPFLVIESAKSEYRDLLAFASFEGMQVFTMGDETVAPFRLNPFEVPDGILVQSHIDHVKALFAASFVLYPPMPYVLEQSLQEVYEDRGWDLAANVNRRGQATGLPFPTLTELHRKVEGIVRRLGYDQRLTMDVTAGLQARINQLRIGGGKGRMLDTRRSLRFDDLMRRPCLLELKQVVSDDEKAFLIGLVMIRLLEHLEIRRGARATHGLRHVTFVEEAHRLLRNVSDQAGEDTANPRGKGVEIFANMLAEVRAYGEGIVILEQIPGKLAPDAIKNTNLKITHRIVARDDREALGAAMRADPRQVAQLSVLDAGDAVVFAEGMESPALVAVPLSAAKQERRCAVEDSRVREAWRSVADPEVYRRSSFCVGCPSAGLSGSCAPDPSAWNGTGRRAFEAFLSAMAHNRAFLRQAYSDVELACRSARSTAVTSAEVACTLNAFLEESIEERFRFAGWPYSSELELERFAYATTRAIAEHVGTANATSADRSIARTAAPYGRLLERLSRIEDLPFAACCLCRNRCRHRFEAAERPRNMAASTYFEDEFADTAGDPHRLALVVWSVTKDYIHPKDVTTRRDLAVCFACQQAARLRLSSRNQILLVENIAGELQVLAEEEHGTKAG